MLAENRPSVFLDTNVLASGAYMAGGPPHRLLQMHEAGLITIYLSQRVIDEIALVVVNKLPTAVGRLWKILQSPGLVILADSSESGPLTVNEQDRPIVATAIDANIEYFLTGDRTLLTECRRLGLDQPQFVSPRELLDLIEASP